MPRLTGLQAYQRILKLTLEDAERELSEEEFFVLREIVRIGLGFPATEPRDVLSPTHS